jgi:hypothetical protein
VIIAKASTVPNVRLDRRIGPTPRPKLMSGKGNVLTALPHVRLSIGCSVHCHTHYIFVVALTDFVVFV